MIFAPGHDNSKTGYNFILASSDVFERGGLVLDAGKKIIVYATSASPSLSVFVTGSPYLS